MSLTRILSASNHIKCVLLSNQKCMTQPTFINLYLNKYSQELYCYPFSVKSDICVGSCNTLNDLSNKVCVPNETEDLNLSAFKKQNMYHANVNVNFMVESIIQIKSGIMINADTSAKNTIYVKRLYLESCCM